MRIAWITACLLLPLCTFASCGSNQTAGFGAVGCARDTDCKGDRICVQGVCTSGAEAGVMTGTGGSLGGSSSGGQSSSGSGGTAATGSGATNSGGASGGRPSGNGGASTLGDAGTAPECTRTDLRACQGGAAACCTLTGTCGTALGLLGCVENTAPTDAGTGGGLIGNAACVSCRASSCPTELAKCNASAKCKALSSCLDNAALPFGVITCVGNADQPTKTLYDALSSCASAHCNTCANISL